MVAVSVVLTLSAVYSASLARDGSGEHVAMVVLLLAGCLVLSPVDCKMALHCNHCFVDFQANASQVVPIVVVLLIDLVMALVVVVAAVLVSPVRAHISRYFHDDSRNAVHIHDDARIYDP